MLALARDIYESVEVSPAELAGFTTYVAIENRLLDLLIPARFRLRGADDSGIRVTRREAKYACRWLSLIAAHLEALHTPDLGWLQLCYALPAFTTPIRRAVLGGSVAWVVTGILFGAAQAISHGPVQGVIDGLGQGLDGALIVGSVYLLAPISYPAGSLIPAGLRRLRERIRSPLQIAMATPVAYALESGLRDGIEHGALAAGIAFVGNWAVAGTVVWLAARARLFDLADAPVYFNLSVSGRWSSMGRYLVTGIAWGMPLGLLIGYAVRVLAVSLAKEYPYWGLGAGAGAAFGAAFALVSWGRTAAPSEQTKARSEQPTNPLATLRADRSLTLLLAVPLLVLMPVLFGAGFAGFPHIGLHEFIRFTLYGLGIGVIVWLAIALSHAWPQYLITVTCLAARGKLPWRLAAFLEKARELQIVRQVGAGYQFRHARLQTHLADTRVVP